MTSESQKPSRLKKVVIVILLLIIAVVFVGVVGMQKFIAGKKAEFAANMPESVNAVTAMRIEPTHWTSVISATGVIRANQGAMLSAESAGKVTRIHVKAGQFVRKGQLLVELDNAVEEAQLNTTLAQIPAAEANYKRLQTLVAQDSAAQADLDSAKSTYDTLVAQAASSRATIQRRQIYAPFSGKAGIVQINEGQYISAGTEIVRIEDQSRMKVNFSIPQNQLPQIRVGQQVNVTSDSAPNAVFGAEITAIDPAVNKNSGQVQVEAAISQNNELLAGMFVNLAVKLPTESDKIVVPQIAVAYTMYGETVYRLVTLTKEEKAALAKAGQKELDKVYRAEQVEVKTAERDGNNAQIESGLKAGDLIVTGGLQRLSNRALVRVESVEAVGTSAPETKTNL